MQLVVRQRGHRHRRHSSHGTSHVPVVPPVIISRRPQQQPICDFDKRLVKPEDSCPDAAGLWPCAAIASESSSRPVRFVPLVAQRLCDVRRGDEVGGGAWWGDRCGLGVLSVSPCWHLLSTSGHGSSGLCVREAQLSLFPRDFLLPRRNEPVPARCRCASATPSSLHDDGSRSCSRQNTGGTTPRKGCHQTTRDT